MANDTRDTASNADKQETEGGSRLTPGERLFNRLMAPYWKKMAKAKEDVKNQNMIAAQNNIRVQGIWQVNTLLRFLWKYEELYPVNPFSPYNREPDMLEKMHYHYIQRQGN